jgi:hypothetical protein
MGEFLGIMLTIIFFVSPKDVNRIEVWPNASDPRENVRSLSLSFGWNGSNWCTQEEGTNTSSCFILSDGRWKDEDGKVILDIKANLNSSEGTNFVFKPKEWERPLRFSVREGADERTFEIKEDGKTVREFRVKMWRSAKQVSREKNEPRLSETNRPPTEAKPKR